MKILFLIVTFFALSFQNFAQDLSPIEIAKKTIVASGGENWRRPKTLQLSGTATLYFNGQTYPMSEYKMWRIFPSENEICVIACCLQSGRYLLKGYLKSKNDKLQAFSDQCLFPVAQVFSDLTESICNQIEKGEELVNQNKKS